MMATFSLHYFPSIVPIAQDTVNEVEVSSHHIVDCKDWYVVKMCSRLHYVSLIPCVKRVYKRIVGWDSVTRDSTRMGLVVSDI